MAEEIGFENGRNSHFQGLVTLTLTLDPAIRHTVMHHSSTSTYIPNFIEIEETFCGRTNGRTYGRTFSPPLILLGRLLEVDLKMRWNNWDTQTYNKKETTKTETNIKHTSIVERPTAVLNTRRTESSFTNMCRRMSLICWNVLFTSERSQRRKAVFLVLLQC